MKNQTSQLILNNYPLESNLLEIVVNRLLENHSNQLPLLDNVVIILPHYQASQNFRHLLLENSRKLGFAQLAGLQIFTLPDFVNASILTEHSTDVTETRELTLLNALQQHPDLFGNQNALTLSIALLDLFDELTRHRVSLPTSLNDFVTKLKIAYRLKEKTLAALSVEANIVHRLWFAWHQQLDAHGVLDINAAYLTKLGNSSQQVRNKHFYLIGLEDALPAEYEWLSQISQQNIAEVYTQLDESHVHAIEDKISRKNNDIKFFIHPKSKPSLLDLIFSENRNTFYDRIKTAAEEYDKNQLAHVRIYEARTFELEAQAIEIKIRQLFARNKTNIALIVEDRRLARRIHALLLRSGIHLVDNNGWALSTTAAASVIESWLQCIEENFYYVALLDVLKSPFTFSTNDDHLQTVYRLEQDIVLNENIFRDLNRYRMACENRLHKLGTPKSKTISDIKGLLTRIELASKELGELHKAKTNPLNRYLCALTTSLDALEITPSLAGDSAGSKILQLFETLKKGAIKTQTKLSWTEFRHWLSLKLEKSNFVPDSPGNHQIKLISLAQSYLTKFDAYVIGNMSKDHYPGTTPVKPFFNHSVRYELGLPALNLNQQSRFLHFRRLLYTDAELYLSYHVGNDEFLPSPWLELLRQFANAAYNDVLAEDSIEIYLKSQIKIPDKIRSVQKHITRSPAIALSDFPDSLSASAHQTLIDCPYAFFSAEILQLRQPEEIREKLSKSDYGERVHQCLQAFHEGNIKNLPGPFGHPVTVSNRQQAIDFLSTLAKKVFHHDLEDNFQQRGWLTRWLSVIPSYIDWQIERDTYWSFYAGELRQQKSISSNLSLHGRVDRLDKHKNGIAIIDYKTGRIPKNYEISAGEAIQLAHYALTADTNVEQAEYLELDTKCQSKGIQSGDELANISTQTRDRLLAIIKNIEHGNTLPAWGIEERCDYCSYTGLCRRNLQ